MLCPWARYFIHCLILIQSRKTGNCPDMTELENLKVLRRSPDLFNNVKKGQGFKAYNKTYFVLPYKGVAAILVK